MTINSLYFFLTFLVTAISGNPAMGVFGKEMVYIGTLMIFMVLWWLKPLKLIKQDLMIFVCFVLLVVAHVLLFGSIVISTSLGFLIKLGIALFAVRLIAEFSHRYISVMYVLSLISFVFWIPLLFGVNMQEIFSALRIPGIAADHYHIGIYNLRSEYDGAIRNMSMFWEPGAFAGYLMLALFFLTRGGQNKALLSKHGLVLISALLSTQSTTGYLAFMLLVMVCVYNADLIKGKVVKFLVSSASIVVLIGGAYVVANEVSFLGEKINSQIQSVSVRDEASRINRFGNFIYDLEWIAKRPILGWSVNPATRFSIDPEAAELILGQGNGLTGFAVRFGLIGLLVFLGFFAHTTRRITGSLAASLFGIVIVCVLLNGEQFLGFPIFLSLMFLPKNKSTSLPSSHGLAARIPVLVDRRAEYQK